MAPGSTPPTVVDVHTAVLASPQQMRQRLRQTLRQRAAQVQPQAVQEVQALVGPRPEGGYRADLLIEYLHLLQDRWQGLHVHHLAALAQLMSLPQVQVYEVASFYSHFRILREGERAPPLTLHVCQGLACELAGAQTLLARLQAHLSQREGAAAVEVRAVSCLGRCAQAPAVLVGQHAVGDALSSAASGALAQTIDQALAAAPSAQSPPPAQPALAAAGQPLYQGYLATGGYALPAALATGHMSADAVLQALELSGLRGLGGAGFAVHRKWRIVRAQAAPRLMAVNIDEGEPGTCKDRHCLEHDVHRCLEGMLVAAQVVGAEVIYIYLRDEYHDARAHLQQALAALQAQPPCPLPRIELRRGAGAYICGEESAMLQSIEGLRGQPRLRPPYIAQRGLWGRPTLEHNLESLYWVRDIVQQGAAWFAGQGRHGRSGQRWFSVSGRVRQPGVKLAPAGITLRELVHEYCGGMAPGHELYAYLPGGASGGIFPARLADVPLDFDTLQPYGGFIGSAGVIVLGQHDRARDAALNLMRFFAHESCGLCTPCRVGTTQAAALMQAPRWDTATLDALTQVMADTSLCGLGQAAPNPIRCVQQYFAHEL